MKVKVRCSKLEFREDIHFKTQPGLVAKNATPRPPAWELNLELHFSQLVPVEFYNVYLHETPIYYTLLELWNTLPSDLKACYSFSFFKSKLNNLYLLSS